MIFSITVKDVSSLHLLVETPHCTAIISLIYCFSIFQISLLFSCINTWQAFEILYYCQECIISCLYCAANITYCFKLLFHCLIFFCLHSIPFYCNVNFSFKYFDCSYPIYFNALHYFLSYLLFSALPLVLSHSTYCYILTRVTSVV